MARFSSVFFIFAVLVACTTASVVIRQDTVPNGGQPENTEAPADSVPNSGAPSGPGATSAPEDTPVNGTAPTQPTSQPPTQAPMQPTTQGPTQSGKSGPTMAATQAQTQSGKPGPTMAATQPEPTQVPSPPAPQTQPASAVNTRATSGPRGPGSGASESTSAPDGSGSSAPESTAGPQGSDPASATEAPRGFTPSETTDAPAETVPAVDTTEPVPTESAVPTPAALPSSEPTSDGTPEETPADTPEETPEGTPDVSGSASPDSTDDGSACFPADATVTLESGLVKSMEDLTVGDRVSVGDNIFSEVFMFTHKISRSVNKFVRLTTDMGVVELTSGHYLYSNGALVPASTVKIGDSLSHASGVPAVVQSVDIVSKRGLYNPQTIHGDIVVNGIRSSTYTTAVEPVFAHVALAPLRSMFRVFGFTTSMFEDGADSLANALPGGVAVY